MTGIQLSMSQEPAHKGKSLLYQSDSSSPDSGENLVPSTASIKNYRLLKTIGKGNLTK
jgi:hypothetical protein